MDFPDTVGVNGWPAGDPRGNQGMKAWDPSRYRSLVHPGDSYSYDIFSQAGAALLNPLPFQPLQDNRIRGSLRAYDE